MPWGTTRRALIKLFASWDWNAKPLQTAGVAADRTGLKWHVLAEAEPQNFVYNMAHGDVLIVKEHVQAHDHKADVRVEASVRTQRLMQPAAHPKSNAEDPWMESATKLPHVQAHAQVNVASIEASVEAKVLAKLQKPDGTAMDVDAESRIANLESKMNTMQQEQQVQQQATSLLKNQVEHLGQQIDNAGFKVQQHIDQQMSAQMERIEALINKRMKTE